MLNWEVPWGSAVRFPIILWHVSVSVYRYLDCGSQESRLPSWTSCLPYWDWVSDSFALWKSWVEVSSIIFNILCNLYFLSVMIINLTCVHLFFFFFSLYVLEQIDWFIDEVLFTLYGKKKQLFHLENKFTLLIYICQIVDSQFPD